MLRLLRILQNLNTFVIFTTFSQGATLDQRHLFTDRAALALGQLSAAERDVLRFFRENREEVLVSSAAALAAKIGTSDATVIRTTQALGYGGLDDLRRHLADELRMSLSPAARMSRTLRALNGSAGSVLESIVDIHLRSLEKLKADITPGIFETAIEMLSRAGRIVVFGLGPSSALADYFVIQLGRFGIESLCIARTGVLLADDLHRLKESDIIVVLAYTHVYRELESLLARAGRVGASTILLTDSLGDALRKRVDLVLPVARGNTNWFSTHAATLGLIEALLIGLAAKRPGDTLAELKVLNEIRAELAGSDVELSVSRLQPRRKKYRPSKRTRTR
jgi:DNA-binding MurR/RpiR family transcriptional regulator